MPRAALLAGFLLACSAAQDPPLARPPGTSSGTPSTAQPTGAPFASPAGRAALEVRLAIEPAGELDLDSTAVLEAPGARAVAVLTDAGTIWAELTAWSLPAGEVLWSIRPPEPAATRAAWKGLRTLGDVSGDGVPELLLAVHEHAGPSYDAHAEWIECRDGRTGERLWRVQPDAITLGLSLLAGNAVGAIHFEPQAALLDDVDGDGAADFALVSAHPGDLDYVAGAWSIRSGRTGARLHGGATERLRGRLAACADVDGDGLREFLTVTEEGADQLRSGRDGRVLREFELEGTPREAGDVPDFDGDGVPEIAVFRARHDAGKEQHLRWSFRSPSSGAVAHRTREGARDGYRSLRFVRDASTGGSVPWTLTATGIQARALSGERVLAELELGERLEGELSSAGDLDGDGQADLAVALTSGTFRLPAAAPRAISVATPQRTPARGSAPRAGAVVLVRLPSGLSAR